MRGTSYGLQTLSTLATIAVMLLSGWWIWEVAAGPARIARVDGHVMAGALELIVGQAVPVLAVDRHPGSLPRNRIADLTAGLLLGRRLSDHEGLLTLAVPALVLPEIVPVTRPGPPDLPTPAPAGTESDPPDVADEAPVVPPRPKPIPSGEVLVLVYHAHAREAYMPERIKSGEVRFDDSHSDNPAETVITVGEEIVAELRRFGINALHAPDVNDRHGRLGAYKQAESLLARIGSVHPDIQVYFDVHRDAQRRALTTVVVDDEAYARVMLVLGQENPDWRQNYEFGCRLLDRLEERVPGISRGVFPKASRYNQHVSPGALLLEIGGPENHMDEARRSARLIARVLAEMILTGELPPYTAEQLSQREVVD